MNLLLMLALFVVTLLLLIRLPERPLSALLSVVTLLLAGLLVSLNMNVDESAATALGRLSRMQGFLVLVGTVLGSAAFALGSASLPRMRPIKPLQAQPAAKPMRLQRTAKPATRSGNKTRHTTPTLHGGTTDLNFQEYEVLDRVGVGGMGSVYRARRRQDGRVVALKVPQEKYLADAKFVKRFYREAEVLKRFNHPNIVKVYDYRMQDPEHYIAMEFLDGESLEHLLEDRPLTFGQSVQMLRAMADALRHIHMQNVVHRDIKPANVMVLKHAFNEKGELREGGVKLMDFGIAVGKVLTRLTMTGARVGTPIYMAPEQAKGNRVDARSDVYSLGLLAYEMVTGQTAFKGSYEAVVHQQVFESPKPPKQVNLEVPGQLSDLILDMIEKDPAQRPTLDSVIARIDAGVLADEAFTDPVALAISIQEKRGTLRLLDLKSKLRVSLRDQGNAETHLPSAPNALTGDPAGNLYLSLLEFRQERSGALIRKIDAQGRELAAFGAYGLAEGELLQPVGLAYARGHLYVLDAESLTVNVYDGGGRFVRRFGGRGKGLGRFEKPTAIAAAPSGEVYVLDGGSNEVQRFSAQGEYVSRYAFRLDRSSEALRPLDGLSVDREGGVYIVDSVARKLRKIEADGTPGATFALETLVGEPTDAPWLMQIAQDGSIYAVRQGGQMLRQFSSVGDLLSSRDMYAPVLAMTLIDRPAVAHKA
ncbi:protein kinase domain-containing protein [Deinococcus fonticola]|uniref:protein kinase domain-containing protein n=1 Tax=Deinococcus fonticola TaxID=2528713 RepID=UPI0010753442|nr:protein kinase [Deinococcus fonticola]